MKTENIKIIVIDDDPFAMAMTEETIRASVTGGKTTSFSSAADALKYLETENESSADGNYYPGIILSDLHMPGIDGSQFLDEFAKLSIGVQNRYSAFVLSSTTDIEVCARLSEKPCFAGFCSKPLTAPKLLKMMETACREFKNRNPGYTAL
jgi:CheY-like chemotaxis protein